VDHSCLDNPVWESLHSVHADIARRSGACVRYPGEFAPFLAVVDADAPIDEALEELLEPGESVFLVGVAPRAHAGARLHSFGTLAQMVCESRLEVPDGPDIIALGDAHRADVLALTALVYPHYFRPRTMDMGRYFGIYEHGRLAAMIGERMGSARHREISAVCTHPDFNGRGLARRLLAMLGNDVLAKGLTPFLHVSHANLRAKTMYERMGYRLRAEPGFWELRRDEGVIAG